MATMVATDIKREILGDAVKVDYDSEIKLTTPGESNEMPLRKVTLYKNNVAFYTRYGNIEDDHKIELSFPDDQAARVVKTLKLKDYGDGSVTVQYRTDETDMQGNFFEQVGVGNYEQILNSLRGIRVNVSTKDEDIQGICVGTSPIQLIEERKVGNVNVVHILTGENELKGFRVCDIKSFKILDDKVANDFSYFVRGVPQTKQTKKKKIALSCQGSGTRRVECSYVGKGFMWSAQYRILFSNHVDPYVGEYQWQYLSDEYKWMPFSSEDNELLESALQKNTEEFVEVTGGVRKVNIISKIQMNSKTNRMRIVRRHAAGDNVWVGADGYRIEQVSGKNWIATFEGETEKFEYVDTDLVNDFTFLVSLETENNIKLTTRNMQDMESGRIIRLGGWASRGSQKCSIQCLASVKNPTLEDWDDIELCLVAGGIQFVDDLRDDDPEPMITRNQARQLRERAALTNVAAPAHLMQSAAISNIGRPQRSVKKSRQVGWFGSSHRKEQFEECFDDLSLAEYSADEAASPPQPDPEPTGMAVSNARDEDMTMFTVRKPVTLAKNRAALVEMFESDLLDARKLVVCGLAPYSLSTHSKSRIECKNGIFMTNTTGHGLENGLCSVVDSTADVYMGEGYLACKQDGVSIVTYANERTLRVEGQIVKPEDGISDSYENGSLKLFTMTGKPTEDISEAYSLKVKGVTIQTTKYTVENSSRREYPWVMIYHNSFGELESPKERFITFGRSDLHAQKKRFVCNVGPSSKQELEVVENKEFERTKTLYLHRHNSISELEYKTWIESGLISESMAKKLKARGTALQPNDGFCSCTIL